VTLSFKGKIQQKYSMANIPYYTSTWSRTKLGVA
jgi:hypothetical protein